MERREQRQIERWAGIGRLMQDGQLLAEVRYVITAFQIFHIVRPNFGPDAGAEEIPGLTELSFRIDHGRLDLWRLTGVVLTLHLADGRHVDVFHDGHQFVAAGQVLGP